MEKYNNWSEEDLEDLDAKFDALAEFLEIEFVFERVSDGSDVADSSRCYARRKKSTANQWPEQQMKEEPELLVKESETKPEPEREEEYTGVPEPVSYEESYPEKKRKSNF